MSNRKNIRIVLPLAGRDYSQTHMDRLIKSIEQVFIAITSIQDFVVNTLTIQNPSTTGYNLTNGTLWVDDDGIVRVSLARIAVAQGSSSSVFVGTVTVTTS